VAKELGATKEIPILKWTWKCWNCGNATPVVSYCLEANYLQSIGMIEKLDLILVEKYPLVRLIKYPKPIGRVIANFCEHCGKPQGNSYISRELQLWKYYGRKEEGRQFLVEMTLPNNLTVEDLKIESVESQPYEVRVLEGEMHHKDFNWENNDPSNLILLCKDCHNGMGSKTNARRSRKQVRDERRIRREKKQADKWRENYYAQKRK